MPAYLRLLLSVLFLLAASLSSATPPDKKGGDDKEKTANYFPMQVGNRWTYRVSVGGNTATAVSSIAKIETIDKIPLARLEAQVNGQVVASEHLQQTKDGVFRHRNNGQDISPPFCLLKYPVTSGAKWKGEIKVGAEKGKYAAEAK